MALILIFAKIFASSITLGSGGSGGIFAPSLFVGAMMGALFGYVVNILFPEYSAHPGAYSLVAMGGMVAGTTRAPITAILIVFELTKENAIILPLMLTCIGSVIVSTKLSRESIYTLKLLFFLFSSLLLVTFTNLFSVITEDKKFSDVINNLISNRLPFVSVVDKKGGFMGMISLIQIKDQLFEKDELNDILIAGDIADPNIPKISLNDNCRTALRILNEQGMECLPVMDPENDRKQIGMIWRKDIDDAYQKEIERVELTSDLASKILVSNAEKEVHFLEGYVVSEVPVPSSFAGKSLRELKIRSTYGVDVLSIKCRYLEDNTFRKEEVKAIPDADQTLSENDLLVIAGEAEKVNKLKQLV